ncbi:MAG: hypothetical protein VR68_04010 [Peptococcaceae bacterium BRH_c4a]|nr:MAG: hypothetical protein VR68_04010 [Peptococcaceae bacterium BRH_c4a]
MSDDKDKVEGLDVSGCMPPGPPCDDKMDHIKDTLMMRLKSLKGLEVTIYVMSMGPVTAVPAVPAGGAVVPGAGAFGITGIIHHVGMDYLEINVMMGTMRMVFIPFMAIAAVVPGGPLIPPVEPGMMTTLPGTL